MNSAECAENICSTADPFSHEKPLKLGKRASEEDCSDFENHSATVSKKPRSETIKMADCVNVLRVRLKKLNLELVSRTELNAIDPISSPVDVRIRSRGYNNLFLTVDRALLKPKMSPILKEDQLEDFTFILEKFYSDEDGTICTVRHKNSGLFLAVAEDKLEPTLWSRALSLLRESPAMDRSSRMLRGTQPVSADETDSSEEPERCCMFCVPQFGVPTSLISKMCEGRSLTYDRHTGWLRTVGQPQREDFLVQSAHKHF